MAVQSQRSELSWVFLDYAERQASRIGEEQMWRVAARRRGISFSTFSNGDDGSKRRELEKKEVSGGAIVGDS